MSGRRLLAAAAVVLATGLTGGCAQETIADGTFSGLTPSATPTYGVATSDLHSVDLPAQVREDPRVPAFLRDLLLNCGGCLGTTTTWVDVTGDGRDDAIMAFTESGAPYATVIYGIREGHTSPVFIHVGRYGAVTVEGQDLVLTRPMYAESDPVGRPSGVPLVSRFRWNGERFTQVARSGGGAGLTTFDSDDKVIT